MKKRSSVEKANWSSTREEWYKAESLRMAFNMGFELIERDDRIFKITPNKEDLFCEPTKIKTLWFETWAQLVKMCSI